MYSVCPDSISLCMTAYALHQRDCPTWIWEHQQGPRWVWVAHQFWMFLQVSCLIYVSPHKNWCRLGCPTLGPCMPMIMIRSSVLCTSSSALHHYIARMSPSLGLSFSRLIRIVSSCKDAPLMSGLFVSLEWKLNFGGSQAAWWAMPSQVTCRLSAISSGSCMAPTLSIGEAASTASKRRVGWWIWWLLEVDGLKSRPLSYFITSTHRTTM